MLLSMKPTLILEAEMQNSIIEWSSFSKFLYIIHNNDNENIIC